MPICNGLLYDIPIDFLQQSVAGNERILNARGAYISLPFQGNFFAWKNNNPSYIDTLIGKGIRTTATGVTMLYSTSSASDLLPLLFGSISITFIYTTNGTLSSNAGLFSLATNYGSTPYSYLEMFILRSTSHVYVHFKNTNSGAEDLLYGPTYSFIAGNIYTIILTSDASTWKMYINGVLQTPLTVDTYGANHGYFFGNLYQGAPLNRWIIGSSDYSEGGEWGLLNQKIWGNRCLSQSDAMMVSADPFLNYYYRKGNIFKTISYKKHQINPTIMPVTEVYTSAQAITLSSAEADAIYYTTDGSTPDITKTLYTTPFVLAANAKIQAIAIRDGRYNSNVSIDILAITDTTPPVYNDAAISGVQDDGITVTIPSGSSAYHSPVFYRVYSKKDTTPTISNSYLVYEGPGPTGFFCRDGSGVQLATGNWHILTTCLDSVGNVTAGTHEIIVALTLVTAAPVPAIISQASMSNFVAAITMSTALSGGSIYYTTDGSTPTAGSTLYAGSFNIYGPTTIKAITVKTGYSNSGVCTAQVLVTAAPATDDPILESILGNRLSTLQGISVLTGFNYDIGLATREMRNPVNLLPKEYPAVMLYMTGEADDEQGATEQNVLAVAKIAVLCAIYSKTNTDAEILKLFQDVERAFMVNETCGGLAIKCCITGKPNVWAREKGDYVSVGEITFDITYQYIHGHP